jgi:hypothetical protein
VNLSDLLFRVSALRPRVRLETLRRKDFTDATLRELHALASRLMAEDLEHFRVHAQTNDLVHVFRRTDSGEVVGFQFWRMAPIGLPRGRVILGGKLRILPEFRGRGLHLLSGLVVYLQDKLRHPGSRYYRLSIASLFGFVSITEALAHYELFDPKRRGGEAEALREVFLGLAHESHFDVDEERGLFRVNIFMTPETLPAPVLREARGPRLRLGQSRVPHQRLLPRLLVPLHPRQPAVADADHPAQAGRVRAGAACDSHPHGRRAAQPCCRGKCATAGGGLRSWRGTGAHGALGTMVQREKPCHDHR